MSAISRGVGEAELTGAMKVGVERLCTIGRLTNGEHGSSPSVRPLEVQMRSTEEVLRDHLERRRCGDLEGDLAANYSDAVVVLCKDGIFHGKDGIRQTASILHANLPDAYFNYDLLRVADSFALLSWSADASNGSRTCHGADSFVVRYGRIIAQTIHFETISDRRHRGNGEAASSGEAGSTRYLS